MQAPRSLGIIGHGDFGRFLEMLARRFAPGVAVRVYARKAAPDGQRFFTLEETCQSDVVIISVSIRAFAGMLAQVLPLLKPGAILIDVNTVKEHPAKLLRESAKGVRYVTSHPMFGPYSFEKQGASLKDLRLVIADHTLAADEMADAIAWLKGLGLNVMEMTPEAHDRMLAETLFLTHYVAQAVARGGFVRTDIDTLSFGFLMDAVESVRSDTELFRDVFAFNPYCEEIIRRFEKAEAEVHALLEKR
ncbi:MAG TPA: prephenate dehydrogenase/arogenate dehydrogenase family protein [Rhizomicrobium sp.]|jgi:prephenate dehydrogenase|nr:prephenate dehydrogenase/arogenate dehydrogenase family protein [Rhizomicrobium sp.]